MPLPASAVVEALCPTPAWREAAAWAKQKRWTGLAKHLEASCGFRVEPNGEKHIPEAPSYRDNKTICPGGKPVEARFFSPGPSSACATRHTLWPGEKQLAEKSTDSHGKTAWIGLTL